VTSRPLLQTKTLRATGFFKRTPPRYGNCLLKNFKFQEGSGNLWQNSPKFSTQAILLTCAGTAPAISMWTNDGKARTPPYSSSIDLHTTEMTKLGMSHHRNDPLSNARRQNLMHKLGVPNRQEKLYFEKPMPGSNHCQVHAINNTYGS